MNEAVQVPRAGFLTTAELAALPDFTLGLAAVSPSSRTVAGPSGTADVEPRVMQVLVVLAGAAGQVVTRATLFERCWGGIYVGDDSLNRAVAAVRKVATEVAAGSFEIETIPRTGYRLTGQVAGLPNSDDAQTRKPTLSRRTLIGGGAGILLAGGGAWWSVRSRDKARFDELIETAENAIRTEEANKQIIHGLEEAVALRPNSARAWGLLGFFNIILAQLSKPNVAGPLIGRAQEAAKRALSMDPTEPNALMAMFELQGSTLDFYTRDQRLRRIIAIDPTRIWAIAELVMLLQAAGLTQESQYWNERALSLVPFSPDFLGKRALKLWIAGNVPEADKVIDQARAINPTDPWDWWSRFLIFAMTGRAQAAQAMLNADPAMIGNPVAVRMWRTAFPALIDRSTVPIGRVRDACFDAAKATGQIHGEGVMILSRLGDVDGAYAITQGILLGRGPIVPSEKPGSSDVAQEAIARVNMQWIFTPPCKPMRADPRFGPVCDDIGLTEYWRRRGIAPDYMKVEP